MHANRLSGWACIALAIAFNVPYMALTIGFNYPDILRQPAAEILAAFAAGGDRLVLTWWALGMSALGQTLVACALLAGRRDSVAISAAILGSLAGLTQAIGLWRWVFAVPGLATAWQHAGPSERPAIEAMFSMLHQYGGVAIGEHLGQWLTVAWIVTLTRAEIGDGANAVVLRGAAIGSAVFIGLGTFEALTTVTALRAPVLELGAPIGYALFSLWLIMIGVRRLRSHTPKYTQPVDRTMQTEPAGSV